LLLEGEDVAREADLVIGREDGKQANQDAGEHQSENDRRNQAKQRSGLLHAYELG
jgi:hypothetical protein